MGRRSSYINDKGNRPLSIHASGNPTRVFMSFDKDLYLLTTQYI